jgi:uncharacterized protein YbjT (DUF2867 family)
VCILLYKQTLSVQHLKHSNRPLAMASPPVIVFGATGRVGCHAAVVAMKHGAKVFMATRDLNKPIPHVPNELIFDTQRVYADLSKPETVREAIVSTGAKRAFFYMVPNQPNGMKGTLEAMKAGGVEFVVFLSTLGVAGDKNKIGTENPVAWQHAQIEKSLEDTFTLNGYIAIRSGYFATNVLAWKKMVSKGEVKIPFPNVQLDYIDPQEVATVAGKFLAGDPQALKNKPIDSAIPLCGANMLTQQDAAEIIGKVLDKNIEIIPLDENGGLRFFVEEAKLPEIIATTLIKMLKLQGDNGGIAEPWLGSGHQNGVSNVEKFTGNRPVNFETWVQNNKHNF